MTDTFDLCGMVHIANIMGLLRAADARALGNA